MICKDSTSNFQTIFRVFPYNFLYFPYLFSIFICILICNSIICVLHSVSHRDFQSKDVAPEGSLASGCVWSSRCKGSRFMAFQNQGLNPISSILCFLSGSWGFQGVLRPAHQREDPPGIVWSFLKLQNCLIWGQSPPNPSKPATGLLFLRSSP